jgi:hypothetical protein
MNTFITDLIRANPKTACFVSAGIGAAVVLIVGLVI